MYTNMYTYKGSVHNGNNTFSMYFALNEDVSKLKLTTLSALHYGRFWRGLPIS